MDPASVFPDHYRDGQQDRITAHWNLDHRLPVPRKPIVCGQCGGPMVLKQWWFHDRTKTGTSDPYRCSMEAKCVACSWVAVYGVRIPAATGQAHPDRGRAAVTAAVWIVGGPAEADRSDLRYSLRSVAAHAPTITEAWVIGDVPAWFTGTRMPLEPLPGKFANQRQSLTRFANHPGAPEVFWLFNDDMIVTEPTADLPIVRGHAQTGMQWASDHRNKVSSKGVCVTDCYQCAVAETAAWTHEQTGTDPHIYEAHSPLLFDTTKLRDVLAAYPDDRPFAVGEVYPIAGAGGPGRTAGNAKVKKNDPEVLAAKLANPSPYLSSSPESWAGVVGGWVRPRFPDPSRWER